MATLTIDTYPTLGLVRVVVNAAEYPAGTCVQVRRLGDGSPLRTHVWQCEALGEWQQLSGGLAVFWDAEAPLDVAFHYELAVANAGNLTPVLVRDTFTRTVSNGFGTADTGQVWGALSGTASEYATNGAAATQTLTAVLVTHAATLPVALHDIDLYIDVGHTIGAPPTGGNVVAFVDVRLNGSSSYRVQIVWRATNDVTFELIKFPGNATFGGVAAVIVPDRSGANGVRVRLQAIGNLIQAKAYRADAPEPDAWTFTGTDTSGTSLGTGDIRLASFRDTGNTNSPVVMSFDTLIASSDDGPAAIPVKVSPNLTLASGGQFWLRDPARPCNNMPVVQCPTPGKPNCVPGDSVFLQRLDVEGYPAAGAAFLPTNAKRMIPVTRRRRDADSKLVLVSRTFAARDLLLAELDPGGGLQFVAPPAFGIPDRYLQVHDVTVSRMTPDHRIPWRSFDLPFTTIDRPVGPAQGVCGARINDLCDLYPSWSAIAATGMPWIALEQGLAGTPTPPIPRTWSGVNAGFANWTAVAAKTWDQIRLGT